MIRMVPRKGWLSCLALSGGGREEVVIVHHGGMDFSGPVVLFEFADLSHGFLCGCLEVFE